MQITSASDLLAVRGELGSPAYSAIVEQLADYVVSMDKKRGTVESPNCFS